MVIEIDIDIDCNINLAKLDDGLAESPTVMVVDNKTKQKTV
jgi:hypothetical protein